MKRIFQFFSTIFLFVSCFSAFKVVGQHTERDFRDMVEEMSKGSVKDITVEVLKQKKAQEIVLLDTRERKEYDVSHLANARWVGFDGFDLTTISDLPKSTTIVTYCSVGYRSERIGEQLQKAGYQHVINLKGGIFDWVNKGNPVVDGKGKPVQKVHGYDEKWGKWVKRGRVVY